MSKPLKILYVTSEMAPLLSTGGLADVAAALPRALRARGHDVRVVMPAFRAIPERYWGEQYCLCAADLGGARQHGAMRVTVEPDTGVPIYLIEHDGYYARPRPYDDGRHEYADNAERFCFFCLAALHGIAQTGWKPDLIHCHDWHSAPFPAYLKTRFANDPFWRGTPCVFTIHNLAFQGRYPADRFGVTGFDPALLSPQFFESHGDMNLMKGGLAFAEKLSTVSPRYAKEIQTLEYGAGLDGMLRSRRDDLRGILNGVDYTRWNPAIDSQLPARFTPDDLAGKARCKAALQETLGLPAADVPLFGVVSRLTWQKGVDLVAGVLADIAEQGAQVVILGSGEPGIEERLIEAAARHPDHIRVKFSFDVPLSHLIYAGSDFFLMPSRFEPCGLGQLYALKYGAIPIVRRTGGLADSVAESNLVRDRRGGATGLAFVPQTGQALGRTVKRALALYREPARLAALRQAGMRQDFSWERSCADYEALFAEALACA